MHPELLRQLAAERDSARLQHAERRRLAAQVTRAPSPVRRFLNAFGRMVTEAGAARYDTAGSYPDEDTDEALAAYEALEKQRAELAAKLAQPAGGG
jgi:transposase